MNNLLKYVSIPFIYQSRILLNGKQQNTRKYILKFFNKYKCKDVIDVGCGTGDFANLFKPESYLGIDLSSDYVKYADKRYHHRYKFITADIDDFRFSEKKDAIILVSTLHHLSNETVKKMFKSVILLTKKIIIIVDLNPRTDFIRKLFIDHDRGKYVRTLEQKLRLLSAFGKVTHVQHFTTGSTSQTGLVLIPKIKKK